jgi:hypothetical protein
MNEIPPVDWKAVLTIVGVLIGIAFVLAMLLLAWIIWRVRKIKLPPNADPVTALRLTPLAVVILLDLLDFSLDFLSAPFAWVVLGYLGLKPLRGVAVAESLIPGTQLLPTMTAAWLVVRLTDPARRRF